jgi:hypothetical protein
METWVARHSANKKAAQTGTAFNNLKAGFTSTSG